MDLIKSFEDDFNTLPILPRTSTPNPQQPVSASYKVFHRGIQFSIIFKYIITLYSIYIWSLFLYSAVTFPKIFQ